MRIKRLLVLIYTVYAALVFIILMFLSIPLVLTPLVFKPHGNRLSYLGLHLWAQGFRRFSGIRYQIRGQRHLKRDKSYIFTPNHTSFLDIPALPLIAHHAFKPLAKQEIGQIPVFGSVARAVTVMVDRSNAANRKKSVAKLTQALQAGTNLLVFPEGTINKTEAPLARFYDGAFRMALETQTPIVPVVIHGASRLMPPGSKSIKPGEIHIEILPPISTSTFSQDAVEALKEKVFREMERAVLAKQKNKEAGLIKKDTAVAVPF